MKIVVLAGGLSTERDVSFCSGSMVYKALKENGHQVVLIDVYLGYEGDYIKATIDTDKEEIGLVTYVHELSAYVILCDNSNTFYTLGSDVSSEIEIIGNVFDGYKEEKKDDKQALLGSKG